MILGRAGTVFAAVAVIAELFASSLDAIGEGFGSLNVTSDEVKHNLMDAELASIGIGATMQDVVAVTNAVAGDFGVGATEASKISAQLLDTAKAVGLSNEEAAKLSGILQTTSGLSSEQAERLSEGAFQLAAANNVNPSTIACTGLGNPFKNSPAFEKSSTASSNAGNNASVKENFKKLNFSPSSAMLSLNASILSAKSSEKAESSPIIPSFPIFNNGISFIP